MSRSLPAFCSRSAVLALLALLSLLGLRASANAAVDPFWYGRLGYGLPVGASRPNPGIAFGLGHRRDLGPIALDISALNLTWSLQAPDGLKTVPGPDGRPMPFTTESSKIAGTWFRVAGLWHTLPDGDSSYYLGAGLGLGRTSLLSHGTEYGADGAHADIVWGYEFLRHNNVRMFSQIDVSLPLYRASRGHVGLGVIGDARVYSALVTATLGIGLGQPR